MTVKDGGAGGRRKAAFVVLLALAAGRAEAHPEFSSVGTNRYVTAAVFDGRVDVTDAWLHGAITAVELRRGLDTNRDGAIDPAELRSAEEELRAEGPFLAVELNGRAATAPLAVSIDLGGDPSVGPSPLVVERRVRLARAVDAPETRLQLTVTREPPRLVETELSLVLGPGLKLTGPDRVRFDGPRRSSLESRAATFTLTALPAPHKPRSVIPAVALAVAAVASAVWFRNRRKRQDAAENAKTRP